jgi:DNA replication protein DnaC
MNALASSVIDDFGFYAEPLVRLDECPAHGEYQSKCRFREHWSICPDCARERDSAEKAAKETEARLAEIERWQQRMGTAGIPERFQDRTLVTYIPKTDAQQKALNFATRYADEFDKVMQTGRGALFLGRPGTGKTHLACGIALEVMQQWNASALFTTTLRALRRIKDTWSHGSEKTESQAIAELVFPDLLILDEVGIQFGTDAEKMLLFDVLNERYEKRRPTLMLSNLPVPEVRSYLGERVVDRMREDGSEVLVFNWASHRGSGNAPKAGDQ